MKRTMSSFLLQNANASCGRRDYGVDDLAGMRLDLDTTHAGLRIKRNEDVPQFEPTPNRTKHDQRGPCQKRIGLPADLRPSRNRSPA